MSFRNCLFSLILLFLSACFVDKGGRPDVPEDSSESSASSSSSSGEETPTTTAPEPETSTTQPDPDTSGNTETSGQPPDMPYGPCLADEDCAPGNICANSDSSGRELMGNFCAPPCVKDTDCPDVAGVDYTQAQCLLGVPYQYCVLVCVLDKEECGLGTSCEDVGFNEVGGVIYGLCTNP